jgi:Zn-dependent protease
MIRKIWHAVETIRTRATVDVVAQFDRDEENADSDRGVRRLLLSAGATVARYLGVATLLVAHLALAETAYHFAVDGAIPAGTVYSTLHVAGLSLPSGVARWAVFAGCGALSIVVHELGHVLALVTYRVRVRGVGVRLLVVVPVRFFTRFDRDGLTDLASRQRASVQSAGIAANYLLALVALAAFAQFDSQVAGWLYALNLTLAIVSAVPLSDTDGDRLLSSLLVGDGGSENRSPGRVVSLLAVGSWVVVAGSMLTVAVVAAIRFVG